MPTLIQVGSVVSAKVGPFELLGAGQRRRQRTRFQGTVIRSAEGQRWTVFWHNIQKASDHAPGVLKLESRGNGNLNGLDVQDILTNKHLDSLNAYLATWRPTPAPQPSPTTTVPVQQQEHQQDRTNDSPLNS